MAAKIAIKKLRESNELQEVLLKETESESLGGSDKKDEENNTTH